MEKNIIIGNGVIVQFGGVAYTNGEIIKRAIANIQRGQHPTHLYPPEILEWFNKLFDCFSELKNGRFDQLTATSYEREALDCLKERYRYKKVSSPNDIGFEDYFLIHDLFCRKNRITNPEQFNFRELLRRFFLDSIFNQGEIQNIFLEFPNGFVNFLKKHQNIFTTNYDKNIEMAVSKPVVHLHGAFHTLSETHNPDSFRNKISDHPLSNSDYDPSYKHLFSDALLSYSGDLKAYSLKQPDQANEGIKKFAEKAETDPEIKRQINEWANSDNEIVKNMHDAIMLKIQDPKLSFQINSGLGELEDLKGEICILGLSANNDNHLFQILKNNQYVEHIEYYFFDESEKTIFDRMFQDYRIIFHNVKSFWASLN